MVFIRREADSYARLKIRGFSSIRTAYSLVPRFAERVRGTDICNTPRFQVCNRPPFSLSDVRVSET